LISWELALGVGPPRVDSSRVEAGVAVGSGVGVAVGTDVGVGVGVAVGSGHPNTSPLAFTLDIANSTPAPIAIPRIKYLLILTGVVYQIYGNVVFYILNMITRSSLLLYVQDFFMILFIIAGEWFAKNTFLLIIELLAIALGAWAIIHMIANSKLRALPEPATPEI